ARSSALSGILNGIDEAVWNPASDPNLAARFTAASLDLRRANKQALRERFGLPRASDAMLFGVISRLSWQKGLDLLIAMLPRLLDHGADLVVLGAGEERLEAEFRDAASAWPDRVGAIIGYDEGLAHLIQGGADAI